MSQQSSSSESLYLLDSLSDYCEHADKLLSLGRRKVRIFSNHLEALLYDREELVDLLSALSRRHPQAQIEIMVRETRPLVEQGHRLVRLAQRIPSKFTIRKLGHQNDNDAMGFMMVDADKLLYKNDDTTFQGFANYEAAPEVKQLMDTWLRLWQSSQEDPQLRTQTL